MNKLAILAATALAAATFGTAAMAQETTATDFASVDANKDAVVSWDEALAVYPTLTEDLFKQADANADGNLDEAEYTALQGLTAGAADSTTSSSAAQ